MAPRILLNALFLEPGRSGGVETYLAGLAPALVAHRPDAEFRVVTTHKGARALRDRGWPHAGIAVRELHCDEGQRVRRQLAEQLQLPLVAAQLRADVVHSLSSIGPIAVPSAAHVITLHDVNFFHHRTFGAVTTFGLRQIVPRAARRADALIADTAVARDDICETLDLDSSRFTVVPLAADSAHRPTPTPEAELRRRLELGDGRLILCVSAKRPHKNQEVLVRALQQLPDDLRLVLVGHAEPYERTLRALALELGVGARVVFTEWISDADLEGMWAAATVAAVPSLAEGFGLPLIEAIAHEVPVVASELPVLREVGGTIPRHFDPHDPADAARAILAAIDDPPDRAIVRAWAARFSWEAAAAATWEVYERALQGAERRQARSASA
jgi:glycosyltransferase involved in cell wall biosynthesis